MENVTPTEFARRVGKSQGEISKWISSGKITKKMLAEIDGRTYIKFEYAIKNLNITATRPRHTGKKQSIITDEKPPRGVRKLPIKKAEADPDLKFKPTGDPFRDAELKTSLAKAELAQLNLDKAKAKLIDAEKVYAKLFEFGNRLRKDIQAVPEQIVDSLLACASREEAIAILHESYDDALRALADSEDLNLGNDTTVTESD